VIFHTQFHRLFKTALLDNEFWDSYTPGIAYSYEIGSHRNYSVLTWQAPCNWRKAAELNDSACADPGTQGQLPTMGGAFRNGGEQSSRTTTLAGLRFSRPAGIHIPVLSEFVAAGGGIEPPSRRSAGTRDR